jgi:1-acyl-sn-glycerol-3-phosphate acyltransferase
MIFPEGTRRTDGKVHEFYAGFVTLAKKTGRPVVPVRIFGVNEVYPPEQFWIHYCPIKVVVGEPMVIGETEDDESFKNRVHAWFLAQTKE